MRTWSEQDLASVEATDEVQVSSTRPDGTQRPAVTIWAVRVGGDVFIRSAYGPDNGWFRRAVGSGAGRFTVAGRGHDVTQDVTYTAVEAGDEDVHAALDGAYHAKYDHYGPRIVGSVVGPAARQATLRVSPRD